MRKFRIYLDTSVISHLFHDDAPQRRDETREFFAHLKDTRHHEVYVSPVVINELERTRDLALRQRMLDAVRDLSPFNLPPPGEDAVRLAELYIERRIIPPRVREDALHLALCTLHSMDALVTWNFRHLARLETEQLISAVNLAQGFPHRLRLITPLEVLTP